MVARTLDVVGDGGCGMNEAVSPQERFAEAMDALKEAETRLQDLARRISDLGQALSDDPLTLAPLHPAALEKLPLHIMTHPTRQEIDLATWPDGAEIVEILAGAHAARSRIAAVRAWMLPEDRAATETP